MRNVEMKAPLLALLLSLSLSLSIPFTSHRLKQASVAQLPALVARPGQRNLIDTVHSNKTVQSLSHSLSFTVWERVVRLWEWVTAVWVVATRESAMQILYLLSIITENCLHVPNVVEWEGRGGRKRGGAMCPDSCCRMARVGVCVCHKQMHAIAFARESTSTLFFSLLQFNANFCVIVWGTLCHMPLSSAWSYLFSTFNISNNYKISYNL